MSKFSITAKLNLQPGPGIKSTVADIQRQLDRVTINPKINTKTNNSFTKINKDLSNINVNVEKVNRSFAKFSSVTDKSFNKLNQSIARFNSLTKSINDFSKFGSSIESNINRANQSLNKFNANITKVESSFNRLGASATSNINKAVSAFEKLQNVTSRQISSKKSTFINPQDISNIDAGSKALEKFGATAKKSVDISSNSLERFGAIAAESVKKVLAFSVVTTTFFTLGRAITSGIGQAIEFEKELNKIRQVSGTSMKDLKGLNDEVTKLAIGFGVSSQRILNAAQILTQAGLTADRTKTALEALTKTEIVATFDSIEDSTEAAVAILAQFDDQVGNLESTFGSINAVAAKFAVESADITTAIRTAGGSFAAAGGDLKELMALFTSVRATTRESAETISTGFRTIFTRLQRTRTIDFLQELGIELTDVEGKFVGPFEAVRRLSGALNQIESTDPRFAQIVEELGGYRQISKVIPLIKEFNTAQQAYIVAQQGANSLSEDAAKAQDTLANRLVKVKEEFQDLIRTITNTDTFKAFTSSALSLASALIKVAKSLEPILPILALAGGVSAIKGIKTVSKGALPILGFNSGGGIPGTGNKDTVPAMLTPGEYVINADAAKAIGYQNLNRINQTGKIAKFATGGSVGQFSSLGNISPTTALIGAAILPQFLASFTKLDSETQKLADNFSSLGVQFATVVLLLQQSRATFSLDKDSVVQKLKNTIETNKANIETLSNDIQGRKVEGQEAVSAFRNSKQVSLAARKNVALATANRDNAINDSVNTRKNEDKETFSSVKELIARAKSTRDEVSQRKENLREVVDTTKLDRNVQNDVRDQQNTRIAKEYSNVYKGLLEARRATQNTKEGIVAQREADIASRISENQELGKEFGGLVKNVASAKREVERLTKETSSIDPVLNPNERAKSQKRLDLAQRNLVKAEGVRDERKIGVRQRVRQNLTANQADRSNTQFGTFAQAEQRILDEAIQRETSAKELVQKSKLIARERIALNKALNQQALPGAADEISLLQRQIQSAEQEQKKAAYLVKVARKSLVSQRDINSGLNQADLSGTSDIARIGNNRVGTAARSAELADSNLKIVKNTVKGQLETGKQENKLDREKISQSQILINKTNTQIAQQDALNFKLQATTFAIAGLAAVATTYGQTLEDAARKNLQDTGTDSGLSRGAAFSRAGQFSSLGSGIGGIAGGLIGSAVPGVGTLAGAAIGTAAGGGIGAAIGAITGAIQGANEAANLQSAFKFRKTLDIYRNALERTNKGISTTGREVSTVQFGASQLRRRLAEGGPEGRETALGQISESTVALDQFITNIASTSRSFQEFSNKTGPLVELLADFTKLPVTEVTKRFNEQIKSQNLQIKTSNLLSNAQSEQLQRVKEINKLGQAIRESIISLGVFNTSVNEIAGFASGSVSATSISDTSGIFDKPAIDTNLLAKSIRQVVGGLGGRGAGLGEDLLAGNNALRRLPEILTNITASPLGDEDDLLERFRNSLSDIPEFLRNALTANLIEARGPEGKDANLLVDIRRDVVAVADKISTGAVDELNNFFKEAAGLLRQNLQETAELYAQRRQVESSLIESISTNIDLVESRANFDLDARGFRGDRTGLTQRADAFRQANILGPRNAELAGNPIAIGVRLQESQNRILELNNRLQVSEGAARQELVAAIEGEKTQADRLSSALKFLANTSRLTALQEKFNAERARTETKRGFVKDVVFGNNESNRGLGKGAFGAVTLARTGNIDSIPADFRDATLSFLEKFSDVSLAAFGGKTGGKILEDTLFQSLRKAGFGEPDARAIAVGAGTKEENKIADAIREEYKKIDDAQRSLIDIQKAATVKMEESIIASNTAFQTYLSNISDRAEVTRKGEEVSGLNQQRAGLAQTSTSIQQLQRFTGPLNFDKVKNLQQGIGTLTSAQDAIAQESGLQQNRFRANQLSKNLLKFGGLGTDLGVRTIGRVTGSPRFDFLDSELKKSLSSGVVGLSEQSVNSAFTNKKGFSDTTNLAEIERLRLELSKIRGVDFAQSLLGPAFLQLLKPDAKGNIDSVQFSEALKASSNAIVQQTTAQLNSNASTVKDARNKFGDNAINNASIIAEILKGIPAINSQEEFNRIIGQNSANLSQLDGKIFILNGEIAKLNAAIASRPVVPIGRNSGGTIPGFGSTDTIPAMLTPGEYVLNKRTAQEIGLNKLNALNFGRKKFNTGGAVTGSGGMVGLNPDAIAAFNRFASTVNGLSQAMNNFPRTIEGNFRHTVEVIINGAEVLTRLKPEIASMIVETTKAQINNMLRNKFPDVGSV